VNLIKKKYCYISIITGNEKPRPPTQPIVVFSKIYFYSNGKANLKLLPVEWAKTRKNKQLYINLYKFMPISLKFF